MSTFYTPSVGFSSRPAFILVLILSGLFSVRTSAGSPPGPDAGSDKIIGFSASSSILTGNQTKENGHWLGSLWMEDPPIVARSRDLFDRPFSIAVAYGRHPADRHLILTAELGFTLINSRSVLVGGQWDPLSGSLGGHNQYIYLGSLRVDATRPLADYYESRLLPQIGVSLKFGTGNLDRISWQSVIFTAGPVAAVDIKLSRSENKLNFTALHISLVYAQSFTDGWPSQLELASGLRISWR